MMGPQYITPIRTAGSLCPGAHKTYRENETGFQSILDSEPMTTFDEGKGVCPATGSFEPFMAQNTSLNSSSKTEAVAAYQKQLSQSVQLDDWQKYKDDQLLSNPGGDHYYLGEKKVIADPEEQKSFWGRIKKDLSDAFGNVKNFFSNLFFGAKKCYRDENNQIRETRQKGLIGSVVDFFKDLGSALSFGAWRPDGEAKPEGFMERVGFFFSKMKEAVCGDLIQGIPGSVIHMGEDLMLAGWNLIEVVPDATIGNFEDGRKLTTVIFDNGQVAIDYLTDILPTGEAWLRVHAFDLKNLKAPVLYNINMPEHCKEDVRWEYVRNTPFRKIIETIGSLLADVFIVKLFGESTSLSQERHERNYSN